MPYSPTNFWTNTAPRPHLPPLIIASRKFWSLSIILWGWCLGRKLYPSTTRSCLCCQIEEGPRWLRACPVLLFGVLILYPSFLLSCQVLLRYRTLLSILENYCLTESTLWFSRHLLNRFICLLLYMRAHIRFMIFKCGIYFVYFIFWIRFCFRCWPCARAFCWTNFKGPSAYRGILHVSSLC